MLPNTRYSQSFTMTGDSVSEPANVTGRDFQNVSFYAVGSDTADFSIRILGSFQETPPDFTSASVEGNEWSYVQLKNINDSSYEDGDAGYVFAADGTVQFELNTTGLNWYAIEVFNYAGGQLDAKFLFKTNV
jgi:hypothetical protein